MKFFRYNINARGTGRVAALFLLVAGLASGCGDRPGTREFRKGIRQLEQGNLVRARDLFEQSIHERPGQPQNSHAFQYLGYISWRLGDLDGAEAYLDRSRRMAPQLIEPVYSLGVIAFQREEWTRAQALFETVTEMNPDDARPFEYLAELHRIQRNRRAARQALEEARARAPHSSRILAALARIELQDEGPDAAIALLMESLEKDQDYAPALYNLGRIFDLYKRQPAEAEAYYKQYVRMASDGEPRLRAQRALDRLGDEPAPPPEDEEEEEPVEEVEEVDREPRPSLRQILERAQRLADDGHPSQAVALCMRVAAQANSAERFDMEERALRWALDIDPESFDAQLALARHVAAHDNPERAVTAFRRAIDLDPKQVQARMGLAESAKETGDYDIALNALNAAVELAPDNPSALWALAELYREVGIRRRAIDAYERFKQTFPRDRRVSDATERIEELRPPEPDTRRAPDRQPSGREPERNPQAARRAMQRGFIYQERGELDNALAFYARALEHDPSLEAAHYNTGVIEMQRRNAREARDAFARSVEINPQNIGALYNLGLTHYQLGDTEEALPPLQAVLRIDRNHAPSHKLLGIIYAANPRTHDLARRHYNRLLDSAPNDPDARAIRTWLASRRP